ncbi:g1170 [Coccomyxa viridis]|uniref:G1170 protein n=1 Tax=Coccomyxa viridis TaxID=1274662 RepID=A0ABP1FHD9_9CHLO
MVWAGDRNYFTSGETAYPEDHTVLETKEALAYNRCDESCWHSGGTWLMAVYPVDGRSTLVGFLHAEDHYRDMENTGGAAWKSIAVSYSEDQGITWSKPNLIITSPCQRPEDKPGWGGSSDFSVVKRGSEFFCFFIGTDIGGMCGVRIARSGDPWGQPGSWFKWWEGSFSQPGLGGREGEVKELGVWGGNPSVTWNAYLERWLMVWHGWSPPNVYLSSSRDLLHWEPAVRIVGEEGRNTWYPTIIGDAGDRWCGQRARLYYGSMTSEGFHDRKFLGRDIVFFRPGEPENYVPSKYSDPQYKPLPGSVQSCPQPGQGQPPSCPQQQSYGQPAYAAAPYPQQAPQPYYGYQHQQPSGYGQQGPYGQPPKPGGMGGAAASGALGACLAALCCCGLMDMGGF